VIVDGIAHVPILIQIVNLIKNKFSNLAEKVVKKVEIKSEEIK
jgi:hypothetical protein